MNRTGGLDAREDTIHVAEASGTIGEDRVNTPVAISLSSWPSM